MILNEASDVIGLRDKSGNNNTLIGSNGTVPNDPFGIPYTSNLHINTRPLEFGSEPSGLTVFLVATNNTDDENYQNYLTIFEDQYNNPIQIGIDNINDSIYIHNDSIYIHSDQDGSIVRNIEGDTSNIINVICFNSNVSITIDNDVFSSAVVYQNGRTAYYISDSILTINKDINSLNITIGDNGADDGRTHNLLSNTIYEIIIYNNVLSDSAISHINRYLGQRYSIELSGDGNFNYKQFI